MSVTCTAAVEMEFSGAGNGWTDVSGDLHGPRGVEWEYGIRDSGVADRVATTGFLKLALRNSTLNSGGTLGYYSPHHANVRSGFRVGIGVRLRITYSGTTYTKFVGRLASAVPVPGQYGQRITECVVVDWMDVAAQFRIADLATLTDVASNVVITTILASMPIQPFAQRIGTGMEQFPYALDSARDERSTALSEFQRVSASELGYIFQACDGTFVFEDRRYRVGLTTNTYTIDGTMLEVDGASADEDVVNGVQVTTHPRRVDAAATSVLYSLESRTSVAAGSSLTLLGPYRDPNQRAARVGAVTSSMVQPVATTDYTMNSAEDGTGSDLTANFTVAANFGGNGVRLTTTNNGAVPAYITKLQCRGKGIYDYENAVMEATDASSQELYGPRVQTLDMAYQSNPNVGLEAASYLLNVRSAPVPGARQVTVLANRLDDTMQMAMNADISTRIGVGEAVTGLTTARGSFINGVLGRWEAGGRLVMTYVLEPADFNKYWLMGVAGSSELGDTTRLGYGLFGQFWVIGTAGLSELGDATRLAA